MCVYISLEQHLRTPLTEVFFSYGFELVQIFIFETDSVVSRTKQSQNILINFIIGFGLIVTLRDSVTRNKSELGPRHITYYQSVGVKCFQFFLCLLSNGTDFSCFLKINENREETEL